MIKVYSILIMLVICMPAFTGTTHRSAAPGAEMKAFNPDISVVVDAQFFVSNEEEHKNFFYLDEVEMVFQSFVYPGVFGNVVLGMHEHDGHFDLDLEETYLSFYELPLGLNAHIGRKLIEFGRLNPIHKHHWYFTSFPLVYEELFGDHSWHADGIEVSTLIPNPLHKYIKLTLGAWAGEDDHDHSHDSRNGHDHHHGELDLHGDFFTGRLSANLFHSQSGDLLAGISGAIDSYSETKLYGFDLTYKHRWPYTHRRFRLQNELFKADTHDEEALGFYSLAQLSLDAYWDVGLRYDWTEILNDHDHHRELTNRNEHHDDDNEWALSAYFTYHFNEMMYLRPEYRFMKDHDGHSSNTLSLQLVWGFGPHAHRIED